MMPVPAAPRWDDVISFANLLHAYHRARRGKGARPDVITFGVNLETELLELQERLSNGHYRPGPYRQFTVYERKPRLISAAPFVDRVVHHAVMAIVEPYIDPQFIPDSYACRAGKGVHAAVRRYQRLARRFAYVVHLDVRQYFPSIDHAVLKAMLTRRIADARIVDLLHRIVDSGPAVSGDLRYFGDDDLFTPLQRRRGIPIGNLTSQFFANLYLDDFDQGTRRLPGVGGYIRYVDDLFLVGDNAEALRNAVDECRGGLGAIRLALHDGPVHVRRTTEKLPVLGYQISRTRRWLGGGNGYRFRRRLRALQRAYARHQVDWEDMTPVIRGWLGHVRHAEATTLAAGVLREVSFVRDPEASAATA
jgi:hypothetical protein